MKIKLEFPDGVKPYDVSVSRLKLTNGQVLIVETTRAENGYVLGTKYYIEYSSDEELSEEMAKHLMKFHVQDYITGYHKRVATD